MMFFVKDFCKTMQARVIILGMQVDDDVLYHGIANQSFHADFPYICPNFFLSIL